MDFNEYQQKALETAIYPGKGTIMGLAYTSLGLGESGEVQGKVKKILRDNAGQASEQKKAEIAKELGDLLWYIAATAEELDWDLNEIAEDNIVKLRSRQERGVLGGSGDNR
jgi:NTP pyrophosphatase (non-canonical NTP hydrolase)